MYYLHFIPSSSGEFHLLEIQMQSNNGDDGNNNNDDGMIGDPLSIEEQA